jgi:ElaB/YqjD/DUF883 family membrane-anchored ribosome-binding protein
MRRVMATPKESDLETLQADMAQLRADFAKMATDIGNIASNSVQQASGKAQESAEKMWSEVRRKAENVGQEIEERPFTSALVAFSTGVILGLLMSSRRG